MPTPAIIDRLRSLLPKGWFPPAAQSPNLQAVLSMPGAAFADVWAAIVDAQTETRIRTASGFWLDLIALDYFGTRVQRKPKQSDANFRLVILAQIFQVRVTRAGMIGVLANFNITPVWIFEFWDANVSDGVAPSPSAAGGMFLDYSIIGDFPERHHEFMVKCPPPVAGEPGFGGLDTTFVTDTYGAAYGYAGQSVINGLAGFQDQFTAGTTASKTVVNGQAATQIKLWLAGKTGTDTLASLGLTNNSGITGLWSYLNGNVSFQYEIYGVLGSPSAIIALPQTNTINQLVAAVNAQTYFSGTTKPLSPYMNASISGGYLVLDFTGAQAVFAALSPQPSGCFCYFGVGEACFTINSFMGYFDLTPSPDPSQRTDGLLVYGTEYIEFSGGADGSDHVSWIGPKASFGNVISLQWTTTTWPANTLVLGSPVYVPGGVLGLTERDDYLGLQPADIYRIIDETKPTGTVAWVGLTEAE